MPSAVNRDLFDEPPAPSPQAWLDAFDAWLAVRTRNGELREPSSVAVYRSMWGALTAWCVGRGLSMDGLGTEHLQSYLQARGGADELTPRHAWRLLTLVDAVLGHRAARDGPDATAGDTGFDLDADLDADLALDTAADTPIPGLFHRSAISAVPAVSTTIDRPGAAPRWSRAPSIPPGRPRTSAPLTPDTPARALLMATPEWRYANAADKTPLPEHLRADEARRLVAWLLDPASAAVDSGAPAQAWQSLRNRTAVALQLGAGLTPGDIRAATADGVVTEGARSAGLPWKIRLPAHGATPAREAPLAPWAGRLLRHWLQARQALRVPGAVLFPATRAGRPWGKVAQYGAARAVLGAAGLPDADGGSFKLRHTFALRQLRRGTPPEQVAQWLGLADTAPLARYRRVLMAPVGVI